MFCDDTKMMQKELAFTNEKGISAEGADVDGDVMLGSVIAELATIDSMTARVLLHALVLLALHKLGRSATSLVHENRCQHSI